MNLNIIINTWARYSSIIPPKSYLIHPANIHSHLLTKHGAIRQYDNNEHHDRPESLTEDGTSPNRHRKDHGKGKIIFRRYRPDRRTLRGNAGRRKPPYANSLKFGGRPHVARPQDLRYQQQQMATYADVMNPNSVEYHTTRAHAAQAVTIAEIYLSSNGLPPNPQTMSPLNLHLPATILTPAMTAPGLTDAVHHKHLGSGRGGITV